MGLAEVVSDIERENRERVEQILNLARQEAEEILAEARRKAAEYEGSRLAQADRDGHQAATQAASHAEFEARKHVLGVEARLRGRLRQHILDSFAKLPAATRQKHIKALLATAKKSLPGGQVWGASKDGKVLAEQKTFKHAGDLKISGGIIVESKDGLIRLDLSYETLLDEMWRDVLRQESGLFA